jgi:hypothetical protein
MVLSDQSLKLDFLALNICGLTSKLKYRNIHDIVNKNHFICLSEVRTPFISNDEFPGFQVIISDKKCKKDGVESDKLTGLAIIIKNVTNLVFK